MTVIINGDTGITSPADSLSGNLNFTGTGNRITGDFSNATVANRVMFQTSTANTYTTVLCMPSGTGAESAFVSINNSDAANSSYAGLDCTTDKVQILSGKYGTGTYLPMTFYTGGSESLRLSKDYKTVILSGGNTSANGTGITFPATQSASTDANTLDDYEEGTWSPTFVSTGATFTLGTANGFYTRVGRLVNAYCYIGISAPPSGTTSNSVQIGGLPFGVGGTYTAASVGQIYNITYPAGASQMQSYGTGTALVLEFAKSGVGSIALLASNMTTSSYVMVNITYWS